MYRGGGLICQYEQQAVRRLSSFISLIIHYDLNRGKIASFDFKGRKLLMWIPKLEECLPSASRASCKIVVGFLNQKVKGHKKPVYTPGFNPGSPPV